MRMTFGGAPEIKADRAAVFKALLDPAVVAASAGKSILEVKTHDPTHFTVIAGLGVGSLKLKFNLAVELYDIVEGERAKMRARGKAAGSTMDTVTSFSLEDVGPAITRLRWEAESDVGGTVASVGARLLEGTARRIAEAFWNDFAEAVSQRAAAAG